MLTPTSEVQSALVQDAVDELVRRGVPYQYVTFDRVEVLANVTMVVPVGFLALHAVRRSGWRDWAAYGFVGFLFVELVQDLVLPGRSASAVDVVANTLGMLVGAVVGQVTRAARRRRARGRPAAPLS